MRSSNDTYETYITCVTYYLDVVQLLLKDCSVHE